MGGCFRSHWRNAILHLSFFLSICLYVCLYICQQTLIVPVTWSIQCVEFIIGVHIPRVKHFQITTTLTTLWCVLMCEVAILMKELSFVNIIKFDFVLGSPIIKNIEWWFLCKLDSIETSDIQKWDSWKTFLLYPISFNCHLYTPTKFEGVKWELPDVWVLLTELNYFSSCCIETVSISHVDDLDIFLAWPCSHFAELCVLWCKVAVMGTIMCFRANHFCYFNTWITMKHVTYECHEV